MRFAKRQQTHLRVFNTLNCFDPNRPLVRKIPEDIVGKFHDPPFRSLPQDSAPTGLNPSAGIPQRRSLLVAKGEVQFAFQSDRSVCYQGALNQRFTEAPRLGPRRGWHHVQKAQATRYIFPDNQPTRFTVFLLVSTAVIVVTHPAVAVGSARCTSLEARLPGRLTR